MDFNRLAAFTLRGCADRLSRAVNTTAAADIEDPIQRAKTVVSMRWLLAELTVWIEMADRPSTQPLTPLQQTSPALAPETKIQK